MGILIIDVIIILTRVDYLNIKAGKRSEWIKLTHQQIDRYTGFKLSPFTLESKLEYHLFQDHMREECIAPQQQVSNGAL